MTFFPGGPTYLFAFANAWLTPPAVLLFLGAFWPRFNTRGALWSVFSGMLSMVILTGLELTKIFVVSAYTHMAIVGFAITLVVGILAALSDKPNYFAHPEWQLQVSDYNRKKVSLTEFDQKVLAMINTGHQYMADLCDGLNVSSTVTSLSIEKLDQGGFIERAGLVGSKFYTFTVTEKAKKVLPQLDAESTRMLEDYLSPVYLDFLTIAAENPSVLGNFAKENKLGSLQMSSMISHLARRGYIKEKGLFKRKVEITQSGIQIVKKYASSQTA
jgi:SSS family solute:Na+ symporter